MPVGAEPVWSSRFRGSRSWADLGRRSPIHRNIDYYRIVSTDGVAPRRNQIFERQRSAEHTVLLRLKASLQRAARRLLVLQYTVVAVGVLLAIASGLASGSANDALGRRLALAAALAGTLAALVDITVFQPAQRQFRRELAAIEGRFDRDVLDIPADDPGKADAEPMEALLGHAWSVRMRDVPVAVPYPRRVESLPLSLAQLLCQRVTCWLDIARHQRHRRRLMMLLAAVTVTGAAAAVLGGRGVESLVLVGLAPVVPVYQLVTTQLRLHAESVAFSREISGQLDLAWRRATGGSAGRDEIEMHVRLIQQRIGSMRLAAPVTLVHAERPDGDDIGLREIVDRHLAQGARAADRHRHLVAERRLAICGSRVPGEPTTFADDMVPALSRLLLRRPCQVVHGPLGVGIETMTYLADHYRPALLDQAVGVFGHHNVVSDAEYVVVISGGRGTWDEVEIAFSLRRKVIPLAAGGGAARRAWQLMERRADLRQWLPEDSFQRLGASSDAEEIAMVLESLIFLEPEDVS
jgi:hypothetical protein